MADAVDVELRPRIRDEAAPRTAHPQRIALVQCPAWGVLPPLGPAALKAYVEQAGHSARCFDFNIDFYNEQHREQALAGNGAAYGDEDPWGAEAYSQWALDYERLRGFQPGSRYNDQPLPVERWAEEVLAFEPDVVGFTVYLTSLASSLLAAEEIRRRAPGVTIVFGGPNVSRDNDGERALATRIADFVVDGEGEGPLLELLEAIGSGGDASEVKGIGRLEMGLVVWNELQVLERKIDVLPFPDFSDYDWLAYPRPDMIPIMASRGCVLRCAFCYETEYWRRFRTQSPERTVAEIQHQIDAHPLREKFLEPDGDRFYFMFADSLVNGHPAGLRRMADLLVERGVEIGWGGQATINTKMDKSFFLALRESGCLGLCFGLESGSQPVLDVMGKHFKIEDAEEFVRQVHEAGITVTVNVMVGFPTERRRDFLQTLKFLYRTRKWLYLVSNVTTTQLALGSQLWEPEKYGVIVHPEGTWTSRETGTERNRRVRLHVLHWFMKICRIPHQNIGAD